MWSEKEKKKKKKRKRLMQKNNPYDNNASVH